MLGKYEEKDFVGSVKDVDRQKRRVTGYFSSFRKEGDTPDHDNDRIFKGAFTKTIAERGPQGSNEIFFLNFHNWEKPHGFPAVLKEDSHGLFFESNELPNTTFSNDALELYDRGILKEHSIGFRVVKSDSDHNNPLIRNIKEIKLFEGSNVTLGADSNTPFTGLKCKTHKEANSRLKTLLKAFREGTFQDEKNFLLLEIAIQQLTKDAADLAVLEYKEALKEQEPQVMEVSPMQTIIQDFTSTLTFEKSLTEQINSFTNSLKN